MSHQKFWGIVLLSSIVGGCSYTPLPYEGRELKGPGLFSREKGHFDLVGSEKNREIKEENSSSQSPSAEEKKSSSSPQK